MSKRKKIFLFLLIVFTITVIFYFTSASKVVGSFINDWSLKLARVEKQVMYSAQAMSSSNKTFDIILNVPFHKQEHALSCEVATLKMALSFYNVSVTETELIRDLKFDTKDSRNEYNIWGDPDKGFVGNIDGKIPNEGYGVHEQPIIDLALQYRDAKKMNNAKLPDVLSEVKNGHPVKIKEAEDWAGDLKNRGFRFLGATICYAHMQAVGMVNDHAVNCFKYKN